MWIFIFQAFHLMKSNSFEQPLMHLLCILLFMPFWPCSKGTLFPWLGKLCQDTWWFYVTHIPYPNNNIAMFNAIFPFHSIFPIMAISIQNWVSYLRQLPWCSYLVIVHHFLLSSFHLIGPKPFDQYLAYFLCNANFMPFIHFQTNP